MKKIAILPLLIVCLLASPCWGNNFEMLFTASSHSIHVDTSIKKTHGDGFWKANFSGLYTESSYKKYKWAEVGMTMGGGALSQGVTCEVGLKGLIGDVKQSGRSGDAGAVAFTGLITYDFAQQMALPGSFRVYGGIDYANKILSFMDTRDYLAFHFGLGIPLFDYASIVAEYSIYDMNMKSRRGNWDLNDDGFRMGLSMKF